MRKMIARFGVWVGLAVLSQQSMFFLWAFLAPALGGSNNSLVPVFLLAIAVFPLVVFYPIVKPNSGCIFIWVAAVLATLAIAVLGFYSQFIFGWWMVR